MKSINLPLSEIKLNRLYQKIYDYTQQNYHTHSVLILADFLELDGYKEEIYNIEVKADILGFMPMDLLELRNSYKKSCLKIFRVMYGNKSAKKIASAY
jgi:hypothetical protein